jgi:hypothetical protein
MIYNEGTLQQAQRGMRRRHHRLQSEDPVAYAASEQRCRQRLEALLLAQGQRASLVSLPLAAHIRWDRLHLPM